MWLHWVKLNHFKVSLYMQDHVTLLKSEHAPKQCSVGSLPNDQTTNMDTPWDSGHPGRSNSLVLAPTTSHVEISKEKQSGSHMIQVCHPLHLSPCVNILMQKETDSSLSGKVRFPLPRIYQELVHVRPGLEAIIEC